MSLLKRIKAARDAFLGNPAAALPSQSNLPEPPRMFPEAPPTSHSLEAVAPVAPPPQPKPATKPIPKVFQDWATMHRAHQLEALASTVGHDIGQICLPTGTGKTRVQVHLHLHDMLSKDTPGVYVIAAHRLALCRQLMLELVSLVAKCRIPFDIVFVGSDRVDEDAIYERYMKEGVDKECTEVTTSTSPEELRTACERNPERVKIVVSTYHSLHQLKLLKRIDLITYDEAHTIASSRVSEDNFEAHVKLLQGLGVIQRQYFFTATRKVNGMDGGMNDASTYGPDLGGFSPREAVEAGEIVPPRIHRISVLERTRYSEDAMLTKTIMEAYSRHSQAVKDASPLAASLGAKMLVGAKGTPMVRMLNNREDFLAWCKDNSIRLFTFSSELGNSMTDDQGVLNKVESRAAIFDAMLGMGDSEKAILIHIDILTEGIDLPSITGVLLFRELNLIKLLQTLGRGARLLLPDRLQLYSGTAKPGEHSKMIKPCCWVILSDLDKEANAEGMEAMVKAVRDAYDPPAMQYSREDEYAGEPDPDLTPITPRDEICFNGQTVNLKHFLENMPGRDVLLQEIKNITPQGLAL